MGRGVKVGLGGVGEGLEKNMIKLHCTKFSRMNNIFKKHIISKTKIVCVQNIDREPLLPL